MRDKIEPLEFSKKTVSNYLKLILQERQGVLDSISTNDIEPVHRMRVASRRLRAAIKLFKPVLPTNKGDIWRDKIRKIGRALGKARQLDVQIKFLEATKGKLQSNRNIAQTEKVIDDLKKKRKQEQKKIYRKLIDFHIKEELPGLKDWLKALSPSSHKCAMDSYVTKKRATILKRLDKLLKFSPYVYKPKSIKKLHRMRIAAKKLRYALEILRPWYGVKIDKYICASRIIQDSLGKIHEFDVLGHTLVGYLNKKDKAFNKTVICLMEKYSGLRKKSYRTFVRFWDDLQGKWLWETLRQVV
jgi:CHAD domain-containing protein